MMVAPLPPRPTIALVYADETMLRRNRTREKLVARGLLIKKEYVATSKAYDFSTVDLVVAMRAGTRGAMHAVDSAAERAGVEVIYLDHQESRGGWERLAAYAPAPLAIVPPPPVSDDALDPDATALFAILEQERDEARAQVQHLTGELGNVRADRERLTKETSDLRGRLTRAETALAEMRAVDRALQRLRKKGWIKYANRNGIRGWGVTKAAPSPLATDTPKETIG